MDLLTSFKTLDLVADQSSAANSTYVLKFQNLLTFFKDRQKLTMKQSMCTR